MGIWIKNIIFFLLIEQQYHELYETDNFTFFQISSLITFLLYFPSLIKENNFSFLLCIFSLHS